MDNQQPTSTSTCSNCGGQIYYRRRFGGDSWTWVHGGPAIDAPVVQACSITKPTPAGVRWLLIGHTAAAVLISFAGLAAWALVR